MNAKTKNKFTCNEYHSINHKKSFFSHIPENTKTKLSIQITDSRFQTLLNQKEIRGRGKAGKGRKGMKMG